MVAELEKERARRQKTERLLKSLTGKVHIQFIEAAQLTFIAFDPSRL